DDDDDGTSEEDNDEGLINVMDEMDEAEREQVRTDMLLVKQMLSKLRKLAYKIVNSSTILLPAWKSTLRGLGLRERLMPCDVATRWNSTFDMLDFAIQYRA
ncbi:hypothetical protein M378DRAFT_45632, partial [Amanita muscaria Koide BX008]